MAQTQCTILVEGQIVEEILSFDYNSDILNVTENATFTVDSKNKKYRDMLQIGQKIEFRLSHPKVNGGAPTTKHKGRIVSRVPHYSPQTGTEIKITSADGGWHLENSHAPIWLRLLGKDFSDLCDPQTSNLFDPSWDFPGVRFDGNIRRKLKQAIKTQVALLNQRALPDPAFVVQIEPGDTAASKIIEFARRYKDENNNAGLLLNVSSDGWLCVYKPNDQQKPLYSIRCMDNDPRNNVLEAELTETAQTRWTEVEVVGEQIESEIVPGTIDPNNPNAKKKRGHITHPTALPFVHRHTVTDGEMVSTGQAQTHAEWIYRRGQFDSWSIVYTLNEHYQNGYWYESDTVVSVSDDELGVYGNFYVQAVHCSGIKNTGDTTRMIVRKPGLLTASLGEYDRRASLFKANSNTGTPKAAP